MNCTCTNTSFGVVSETDADMILHLGDFAYDFDTAVGGQLVRKQPPGSCLRSLEVVSDRWLVTVYSAGLMGDVFMRNIEPIAARIPYMVSVGNHENGAEALAQYTERFRHVPANAGTIASTNGIVSTQITSDPAVACDSSKQSAVACD